MSTLGLVVAAATVSAWQIDGTLPALQGEVKLDSSGYELPASLVGEPEPDARIAYVDGMPKVILNGRALEPTFNQSDIDPLPRVNAAIKAESLGLVINQLAIRLASLEQAPGVYDFAQVDERIRRLLRFCPDGRVILNLRLEIPQWLEAHPEAAIAYATGPVDKTLRDDRLGRPFRPSAASREYREEIYRFLKLFADYVKTQPWSKRLIAIRPCWGIYTEWHTYGFYEGPDIGPAMTAAFRAYKGGKYANENPPAWNERLAKPGEYALDPVKDAKVIDYYRCQQEVVSDYLLEVAHRLKALLPGRLVGVYYGYIFTTHPAEGSNVMLDKVLASPDVDFMSDPAAYSPASRLAGGSYYHRTVPATFHRYGKLSVMEDDMRHYVIRDEVSHKKICTRSPREAAETTKRNWVNMYFDGCGIQILDPEGGDRAKRPFSFDMPEVWRAMHDSQRVLKEMGGRPAESGNQTAAVIDWRERLKRPWKDDPKGGDIYVHSIEGLYASGVPVDLMTLDDFLAAPKGRYRRAVFMNLFNPEPEMKAALDRKLADEKIRSVAFLRTPGVPVATTGTAWRELLTGLGEKPLAPEGHYVRRHGDLVLFHTGKTGKWEIEVPGYAGATELYSGRNYYAGRFTVETDGPATLVFRMRRTRDFRSESAAEPLWKTPGLIPEMKLDWERTASRWIWSNGKPRDNEVALFRLAFEADSPVRSGRLAFASDDAGHLYLNGTEIHPSRFAAAVKPGRNVMAVCVTNVYSMGGMIAFGDFTLASGKTLGLRSNAAFRTLDAGKGIPAGWEKADFDDSAWVPAIELGDARMRPFSKYRDYTKDFATAAEREAIAAAAKASKVDLSLPAGIENEPEPSVRVVYEGNRPLVEVNGRRMEPDFSLSGGSNPFKLSSVAKMHELGVRFFRVDVSREEIEKEAGVWDFSRFDERAREILHFAPDGYLTLAVRLEMPKWLAGHPEAWVGYANGETGADAGDERLARLRRPSAASPEYRAEAYRFLRAFGDYVRSRPWGRRVVAVRPCWGIYTEWHTYGFYEGPDTGPAMTAAFRRWKDGLYANENPPTMAERTHGATLLDPSADRKVLDYYDCMANEVSDFLIGCCRAVKEAFPGRLAGAYYGYLFAVHPPEGATAMLEKVLSAPEVDFLSDPAMYSSESRRAGGSYYHRTVTETFHRYGKLSIMEDDMRFHHIRGWTEKALTTETPRESRMTMRRNYLNKLFDGSGIQFCDPCAGRDMRPFAHDDPDVMLGMSEAMDAVRKAGTQPKASGNDTILVISALERFRRDGNPSGSRIIGRTYYVLEWIYRSGIAFDVMTLDDFLREDRGYRRVVMLNAYGPSPSERAALKSRLRRPGVTTLWLVAPGCVLPEGFSDAAMSDLTGLPLRGAGRNPKVSCADGSAERIPQNGVRKTLSDGSVAAFLPEPPSDRWQWRSVLLALGAKPLAEAGNYVRRHGDLVLFHNAEPGEHVIVPPDDLAGRPCEDLFTGERHPAGPIHLGLDGVDTRLFRFVR